MNIKKALVVDDSKVAHLTLRKLLLERGVEVDWVGSGEDCLKYLDTRKPQIIFMDVMMPGMDGFETSRVITSQKLQGSPPIIMCSANATDEDKRDAEESGAVGFLSKPYTPAQLDEVLRMVSESVAAPAAVEAPTEAALPEPTTAPTLAPEISEISGIPALEISEALSQPSVRPELPPLALKPVTPEAPISEPLTMPSAIPEPTAAEPVAPASTAPAPIAPAPAVPAPAPAPALAGAPATGEVEQIAERTAWAAAEKVARDIIQEMVPSLAQEAATQAARSVAEDMGRRAAHAAVRAAQEAAKQVATEVARGTAERTALSTAQESARAVAEQAARQVSEGISQRNVAQGITVNRDELLKEIDQRMGQKTHETLGMLTEAPEFKQQILQMVRSGIQPVIETIARETAERAVQQAEMRLAAQAGPAWRSTLALALGVVALLGSAIALARLFGVF